MRMEGKYLLMELIIAAFEQFFMVYMVISLTDKLRISSRGFCLFTGICLMEAAVYNNLYAQWLDSFVFSSITVILIVMIINKDRTRRKILIIALCIGSAIALLIPEAGILYFAEFISRFSISEMPSDWSDTIYMVHWSELMLIWLYMVEIVIHKRKMMRGVLFPVLVLFIIPTVMLAYIFPIYSRDLLNSFGYTVIWSTIILGSSVLGIFGISAFYRRYVKARQTEKEQAIMKTYEDYDMKYYDSIQKEIQSARFIRHDVVNYMEQIEALLADGDEEDRNAALGMIDEIRSVLI